MSEGNPRLNQRDRFGDASPNLGDRFGDIKSSDDTLNLLTIFIIIVIGWLIISTIQYIFQTFILEKIISFWALIGIVLLLIILYYSLVKATGSAFYLFPLVAVTENNEN